MTGGATRIWPVAEAWDAAVEVTAVVYGVSALVIRAESRGRGPRPPREVWEAKRMAVHVAVGLSNCDYAALGRHIGLHKDTISTHCAKAREACAGEEETAAIGEMLMATASTRLRALNPIEAMRADAQAFSDPAAGLMARIDALEAYCAVVFQTARRRVSDEFRASSDAQQPSSDERKIILAATRFHRRTA